MDEETLILAVQSRPVLYDASLSKYKDLNAKNQAWIKVSEEVDGCGEKMFITKLINLNIFRPIINERIVILK